MDRQVSSPKCRLVLIALASAREQLHLMLAAELRCRCIISGAGFATGIIIARIYRSMLSIWIAYKMR